MIALCRKYKKIAIDTGNDLDIFKCGYYHCKARDVINSIHAKNFEDFEEISRVGLDGNN